MLHDRLKEKNKTTKHTENKFMRKGLWRMQERENIECNNYIKTQNELRLCTGIHLETVQLLCLWILSIILLLFKNTQCFGDSILSSYSGGNSQLDQTDRHILYMWTPAPTQGRLHKPNTS
jgi:hypothetical protein